MLDDYRDLFYNAYNNNYYVHEMMCVKITYKKIIATVQKERNDIMYIHKMYI